VNGDDDRARTEREIGRAAAWIARLTPPETFEPIACENPSSAADRCWRVPGTPRSALAALVPRVAGGGFGAMVTDCDGAPIGEDDPSGCQARLGVLLMFATRDVDTSATTIDDFLLDTTTVWIGTVHLGD
jgi:hypothetical protein